MNPNYQTLAEIEAAYPDQWVLIDRPTEGRYGEVTGGAVAARHADRSEFDLLLRANRLAESAIVYTGELNPEIVYCMSPLCIKSIDATDSSSSLVNSPDRPADAESASGWTPEPAKP